MRQRNDTSDTLVTTEAVTEHGRFPAVAVAPGETVNYPHHVTGLTPVPDEPPAAGKPVPAATDAPEPREATQ